MSNATLRIPSYRRHKPTGQAVVTVGGRDIYLGKWNTAASRAEYNRIIAEWSAHGGTVPAPSNDRTMGELLAGFLKYAARYHRRPDGKPSSELASYKQAMKFVKALYVRVPIVEFGPMALKAVRQRMIEAKLARVTINRQVNRIRHIVKWGVENELCPPTVLQALQAVDGLRYGRSEAREVEPVKPVPEVFVDAVLPRVSPAVAAMIELQRVTGMRSGEVTIIRGCDINTAGKVWIYSPATHKTSWRGHERKVYLGPKAQEIVRPFLNADLSAYLFNPAESETQWNRQRLGVFSPNRKTPIYPSELRSRERRHAARLGRKRRRAQREHYDTNSYYRAIARGIELLNKARLAEAATAGIRADKVALVPHWHPHQLRHNAATALRREHGIEVARIILGHRSAAITEVYAEVDHARAIEVMAQVG